MVYLLIIDLGAPTFRVKASSLVLIGPTFCSSLVTSPLPTRSSSYARYAFHSYVAPSSHDGLTTGVEVQGDHEEDGSNTASAFTREMSLCEHSVFEEMLLKRRKGDNE